MDKELLAQALDVCLQKMDAGKSLEEVLQLYPQLAQELTPPLEAAQAFSAYRSSILVQQSTITEKRAGFLQEAQQLKSETAPKTQRQRIQGGNRRRWLIYPAVLLLLLAVIGGAALAASQALPGEALYPVQEARRWAQLALTRQPADRLALEAAIEEERLAEVKSLQTLGRSQAVQFAGGLTLVKDNQWQIGGLVVDAPADAQLIGHIEPGFWVKVDGELQSDGMIQARQIQPREFVIRGALEQPDSQHWRVAGAPIVINGNTIVQGNLAPGADVEARVFRSNDGKYVARWIARR